MEKSPQDSLTQPDIKNTKVDEELYVNAATLELLQRRLEANVKNAFWRWLGLPIGGVSVVAIVGFIWSLPGYVDEHVGTIISNLPQFQRTVQIQTESYLTDERKGGVMIEKVVQDSAPQYIDKAVKTYLQGTEGAQRIEPLVLEYMNSERGRDQIRTAIDKAVQPLRDNLSSELSDRLNRYLRKVEMPLIFPKGEPDIVIKGTVHQLRTFLRDSAEQVRERGKPFVLTIRRAENHWYEKNAIRTYIKDLGTFFKDQFQAVLIEGEQQQFSGLIPLPEFEHVIADDRQVDPFVQWLNRQSDERLTRWFDPKVIHYASTGERMINLLSSEESWRNRDADEPIAVVDTSRHFLGITSRNTILDQLVVSVLQGVG